LSGEKGAHKTKETFGSRGGKGRKDQFMGKARECITERDGEVLQR